MECPHCNSSVDSCDVFCGECGTRLERAPNKAETPTQKSGQRGKLLPAAILIILVVCGTAAWIYFKVHVTQQDGKIATSQSSDSNSSSESPRPEIDPKSAFTDHSASPEGAKDNLSISSAEDSSIISEGSSATVTKPVLDQQKERALVTDNSPEHSPSKSSGAKSHIDSSIMPSQRVAGTQDSVVDKTHQMDSILGETIQTAKQRMEAQGLQVRVEIGVSASEREKPFTVYEYLRRGGEVVLRIYDEAYDNSSPAPKPAAENPGHIDSREVMRLAKERGIELQFVAGEPAPSPKFDDQLLPGEELRIEQAQRGDTIEIKTYRPYVDRLEILGANVGAAKKRLETAGYTVKVVLEQAAPSADKEYAVATYVLFQPKNESEKGYTREIELHIYDEVKK